MDYTILTSESVLDSGIIETEDDEKAEEKRRYNLVEEQNVIIQAHGYDLSDTASYLIHFFNSVFCGDEYRTETIHDAIQMLAIKEGVDIVRYYNGNIGYVAYYNNHINGFEIL